MSKPVSPLSSPQREQLRRPLLSTEMPRRLRPVNVNIAPHDHTGLCQAALLSADALAILISVATLFTLGMAELILVTSTQILTASALLASLMLVNAVSGLYPGFGMRLDERLKRRWLRGGAVSLTIIVALLALSHQDLALCVAIGSVLFLAVTPLFEDFVRLMLYRTRRWGKPVLVLANSRQAEIVRTTLRYNWALGFLPVTLAEPITRSPTTMVIPASTMVTVEYGNIAHVYKITEGGWLTPLRSRRVLPSSRRAILAQRLIKRGLDISVGLIALVLALPIILVAMLCIYLRDPGPVLFKQERRGQYGKPIQIYKLRSMYLDSAERLQKLLSQDPLAAAQWREKYKLNDDPRILPGIGHFIRRYSVDELPQLWSVITGELSLVGPRVFVDYDLEVYSPQALALRQSVPPGLTGLWQVTVRNDGDNIEKVRYDSAYVNHWSIWSDLEILYRTIGVVVGGRGAY